MLTSACRASTHAKTMNTSPSDAPSAKFTMPRSTLQRLSRAEMNVAQP